LTRIIAGVARGQRLRVPTGQQTRPTSDRVREALFSSLSSMLGSWQDCRVLDLYAGSGALGLEALSRGAARARMVESNPKAVASIRANVGALGVSGAAVVHNSVERVLAGAVPEDAPFDVVLADPPYSVESEQLSKLVADLLAGGWLAANAIVAVERARRSAPLQWPGGIEAAQSRNYGETTIWYAYVR
jgi:16S rRNA (guanine966-N2)-methyltransferase